MSKIINLGWTLTFFVMWFSCEELRKFVPGKEYDLGYDDQFNIKDTDVGAASSSMICKLGLVYVYNISEAFNADFVRQCATFIKGRDLCAYMENDGLGRAFEFGEDQNGPIVTTDDRYHHHQLWYNTWQFALEVYFHERLVRGYECVTQREELASAFFVPYYAGMDLSRRFTHRMAKGEVYLKLSKWLQGRESWKRRRGRDHFMVVGRVASDFHHPGDRLWGNAMLRERAFNEMVVLSIERTTSELFRKSVGNRIGNYEIAIPYPTYFHPGSSNGDELRSLVDWIGRSSQRVSLVTMAAGHRQASTNRVRHRLMTQCGDDPRCTLLLCVGHESSRLSNEISRRNISVPVKIVQGETLNVPCNNPPVLLSAMHQSVFCLQPPGDSPTRRSFFDAMLVGCIPVIFQKEAAWSQYVHHLPENGASYSVYIPMRLANEKNVCDILSRVRKSTIREMRGNIAKLIPRILYARVNERRSETPKFTSKFYAGPSADPSPDAFDIALGAVLRRVKSNVVQLAHNVSSS